MITVYGTSVGGVFYDTLHAQGGIYTGKKGEKNDLRILLLKVRMTKTITRMVRFTGELKKKWHLVFRIRLT